MLVVTPRAVADTSCDDGRVRERDDGGRSAEKGKATVAVRCSRRGDEPFKRCRSSVRSSARRNARLLSPPRVRIPPSRLVFALVFSAVRPPDTHRVRGQIHARTAHVRNRRTDLRSTRGKLTPGVGARPTITRLAGANGTTVVRPRGRQIPNLSSRVRPCAAFLRILFGTGIVFGRKTFRKRSLFGRRPYTPQLPNETIRPGTEYR